MVKVKIGDRMIVRMHKKHFEHGVECLEDELCEFVVEEVGKATVKVRSASNSVVPGHGCVWFAKSTLSKILVDVLPAVVPARKAKKS